MKISKIVGNISLTDLKSRMRRMPSPSRKLEEDQHVIGGGVCVDVYTLKYRVLRGGTPRKARCLSCKKLIWYIPILDIELEHVELYGTIIECSKSLERFKGKFLKELEWRAQNRTCYKCFVPEPCWWLD